MLKVVFVLSIVLQSTICHGFVAQPKIIDGYVTSRDDYPFFVNVMSNLSIGFGRCGGAILNERWIATAAHCLKEKVTVHVYFGIRSNGQFWTRRTVDIANQHMHPEYPSGKLYDIGLIELPEAVQFNQAFLRPAKLPTTCDGTPDYSIVMAVGNGRTDWHAKSQDTTLRHAFLRTLPRNDCEQVYRRNLLSLGPSMAICVQSIGRGNVFLGDSGGPLVRHKDGKFVGIASFVTMREGRISAQVFTDLTYYFEWIASKTGLDLPKCQRPAV